MGTNYRFKNLPVWQQVRSLFNIVYRLVENNPQLSGDFRSRDQPKGSKGSVVDNIGEGFERPSTLKFANFPGIAKGSTNPP